MLRVGKVFKDRDYVFTTENLYFCVVGYAHPPNHVISYLKYAPIEVGGERPYKRVLPFYTIQNIKETLSYLQQKHPDYIFDDKINKISFSAVPLSNVKLHLCPEKKLNQMFREGVKDELERKTLDLTSTLADLSDVSLKFFGVTGSILLGLQNPDFSDIDVTVYGRDNSLRVKSALLNQYGDGKLGFEKFRGSRLKRWCEEKARLYPLTITEAENLYKQIWNRGVYRGTFFSIHPTRLNLEIKEKYGEKTFFPRGLVEVEATVKNIDESIFMPSTYLVEDAIVKSGLNVEVFEVVSYEGLYGGIFQEGEKIVVKGTLEKVEDRIKQKQYCRVVVGSLQAEGKDYIKPKFLL